MSVAILAHKLNRYIGNCNDQIAQKNNFANNNNMLDAKRYYYDACENWLHQKP